MKTLIKYFHLWSKLTTNAFIISLTSRLSASVFLTGKVLRFLFFTVFLLTLFSKTQFLSGYNVLQMLFFYLTFNLLDTLTQLLFREAYRFRPLVVSGDLDLVLIKPMSPLFRGLMGGADPLDLLMLVPYVGALIVIAQRLGNVTIGNVSVYILLFINGFIIATGFHILVLALAIVTTEIDHALMIYRDITSMGRVPVDIYHEPLRSILTFAVPVGIMMTFPAKAFLGLLSPWFIILSIGIGLAFFAVSLRVWRYALSRYASASS